MTGLAYPLPCVLCGGTADSAHHIDRPRKVARSSVTEPRRSRSNRRVPVCTRCHRAIHHQPGQRDAYTTGPNGEDLVALWEAGARV